MVDWLCEGDRCTKFFHARASCRRQKNLILGLEDELETQKTGEETISRIFVDYFSNIFTNLGTNNDSLSRILDNMNLVSLPQTRLDLDRPIGDEIKATLFRMSHSKSPGPNGFHPIFFQQC